MPAQDRGWCDQPVREQVAGEMPAERAEYARSAQFSRGLGLVRSSTVSSSRRTRSSASFDAVALATSASHPASRTKIR
jgi:hypothetical protein